MPSCVLCIGVETARSIGTFDLGSALLDPGSGGGAARLCGRVEPSRSLDIWINADGNVFVTGELPRQCPACGELEFDPRPALCAPIRRAGGGSDAETFYPGDPIEP
jgi:hypothetical protein